MRIYSLSVDTGGPEVTHPSLDYYSWDPTPTGKGEWKQDSEEPFHQMSDPSDRQIEHATYHARYPAEVRQANVNPGSNVLQKSPHSNYPT